MASDADHEGPASFPEHQLRPCGLFTLAAELCEVADLVCLHLGSPVAEFAPSLAEPVDEPAAARAAAGGEHGGREIVEDGRPFPGEGNANLMIPKKHAQVAYTEVQGFPRLITDPEEVRKIAERYGIMRAMALPPAETRVLIEKKLEEL